MKTFMITGLVGFLFAFSVMADTITIGEIFEPDETGYYNASNSCTIDDGDGFGGVLSIRHPSATQDYCRAQMFETTNGYPSLIKTSLNGEGYKHVSGLDNGDYLIAAIVDANTGTYRVSASATVIW